MRTSGREVLATPGFRISQTVRNPGGDCLAGRGFGSAPGKGSLAGVGVMQPTRTSLRHFNDESPLGLRRILSQSTDSLNMRNRTLSVESLIDEGDHAGPGDTWRGGAGGQVQNGRAGGGLEKGPGPRGLALRCCPH